MAEYFKTARNDWSSPTSLKFGFDLPPPQLPGAPDKKTIPPISFFLLIYPDLRLILLPYDYGAASCKLPLIATYS